MKKFEKLSEVVKQEILRSDIISEEKKSSTAEEILKMIRNQPKSRNLWFSCKMILFKNRYTMIERDEFFDWLFSTHLQELVELANNS
jgi:2-oxoglutarate dehydrogenase complex dehydrogenase (E1) component-like enzyme